MGAFRGGIAGGVALGLLVACNAMTGLDALTVGSGDPDESTLVTNTSSSSGGSASSDAAASSSGASERTPHDRTEGDASSTSTPPTQTDAGFDAATTVPAGFTDLFDRPDSQTIGNGWVEKSDRFSIANGAVLQSGTGKYRNLIVSRPDVILDVQTSIDVVYGAAGGDPSLYARVQPASDTLNELVGYTFYAYPTFVAIDRQEPNTSSTELAAAKLSSALVTGKTYRMVFRVTGTTPVTLEATILETNGSPAASLSAIDSSDVRITNGGRVAFGSGDGDGMRFDNFMRVDL